MLASVIFSYCWLPLEESLWVGLTTFLQTMSCTRIFAQPHARRMAHVFCTCLCFVDALAVRQMTRGREVRTWQLRTGAQKGNDTQEKNVIFVIATRWWKAGVEEHQCWKC